MRANRAVTKEARKMSNSSITTIDLPHLGLLSVGALRPSALAKRMDLQETVTRVDVLHRQERHAHRARHDAQ